MREFKSQPNVRYRLDLTYCLTVIASTGILMMIFSGCNTRDSAKNTDIPENMVLIPEGIYQMGGRSSQAYQDEFPRHQVKVSSFYMDRHEVTNRQFKKFVDETGYKTIAERAIDWEELKKGLPAGTPKPADSVLQAGSLVFSATQKPVNLHDYSQWWRWTIGASWKHPEGPESNLNGRMDHPVVHIAWDDAQAYANWAGKRLPTEAEWEWAASGGVDDYKYPWGNEPIEKAFDKANFWQGVFPAHNLELDGYYHSAPVRTFSPNSFGLYDMAGNVWEWCSDKYNSNDYSEKSGKELSINPKGSQNYFDPREPYAQKHVMRGGSFLCNESYCSGYRITRRMSSSKDSGFNHTGFRCVKDI
ncbi:MAG: formylglycine-generating enzyme family protein [Bacteroidota bacterium]